ncbi:DUF5677 domain-containing protein [Pseudomonas capsici]|uniref:DUF5677 domain-containing protein n=1 Tax=Pseudomonas capsici TaxID=2810614 RepID=UPI0021F0DC91|nr:DUF5677 domain-containing protein [Pseudomonas capsici]MCV4285363.1 DUF5677 domain-containing protein [Pseudomonas capsici]
MNKPYRLQEQLDKALTEATAPDNILHIALKKSIKRLNLNCDDSDLKALTNALSNAKDDEITIKLDTPCSLGNTREEIQAVINRIALDLKETINEISSHITETVEQTIHITLEKMADLIEEELLKQAIHHTKHLKEIQELRASTVENLWGKAADQLNILGHLLIEWNGAASELKNGAYANSHTALALNRIILRAYNIVGEILVLARAGYADGALARWRSLHEICVIAMFLSKKSDKCAKMYLAHSIIDELRLAEPSYKNITTGTKNASNEKYLNYLKKQKIQLIESFGPAFAKDLGWAAVELGRTKITFRELESIVEMEILRRGYQHANNAIHGGALAALTRISLGMTIEYNDKLSPAFGCEVAMGYAADSLSILIAELCLETENADLLVMSIVAHKFSSKVRNHIKNAKLKLSRITPRVKFQIRQSEKKSLQKIRRRGR